MITSTGVTFAAPWVLLLIPAVLLLGLAAWLARRGRRGAALAVADFEAAGAAARPTWRLRLRFLPALLRFAAIVLVVIAVARPREGLAITVLPEEGIDVVIAFDVSSSMDLGMGGTRSRMQTAQETAIEFIESLAGDRVGLVVFRSRALALSPLTHDHAAVERRIRNVDGGVLVDGTAIGLGVVEALNLLEDSQARSRVVVLLTDGENNAGEVEPLQAARVAQALGVRLYTIGVIGGPSGFGGANPAELTAMADVAEGRYFDARTREDLEAAYAEIGSLERSLVAERRFTSFREFAPYLAALAVVLLVVDTTLRATWLRRHPW